MKYGLLAETERSPGPMRLPRVLAAGDGFLALEWLELTHRGASRGFDERLGRGLAAMHRLGASSFGLGGADASDSDEPRCSYLATLLQDNTPAVDAPALWIERRLRPTIARLGDAALVARLGRRLDQLAARPDRFGPPEPPARLHGDLWWGNVAACAGEPVIFDPAVYGGHREIDLAMLALFGGLGDRLVAAYDEAWPLADGWRERLGLWQLYPLAMHAVLFGGGYAGQLARQLDELT